MGRVGGGGGGLHKGRGYNFVATNIILSRQKTCFVATKNTCLSRQSFGGDKNATCGSSRQ